MKIQYESTIDEAVEAQFRLLKNSDVAKKWKLHGFIWAPILFIGFYFGIPDEQNIKLIFASADQREEWLKFAKSKMKLI